MTDDGDNVKKLPVRFKNPVPEDRTLLFPHEVGKWDKCHHEKFVIDSSKAEVECGTCGEKLNPMWVLGRLAGCEANFHETHTRYAEEIKRLSERTRTKCNNCGKMTRISRR